MRIHCWPKQLEAFYGFTVSSVMHTSLKIDYAQISKRMQAWALSAAELVITNTWGSSKYPSTKEWLHCATSGQWNSIWPLERTWWSYRYWLERSHPVLRRKSTGMVFPRGYLWEKVTQTYFILCIILHIILQLAFSLPHVFSYAKRSVRNAKPSPCKGD